MSFLLVIVADHLAKAGAYPIRIVVGPFMREGAALVGLHGVDAAEIVVGEPLARAVGTRISPRRSGATSVSRSMKSCSVLPRNAAIRAISTADTRTIPSLIRQHAPHCRHTKRDVFNTVSITLAILFLRPRWIHNPPFKSVHAIATTSDGSRFATRIFFSRQRMFHPTQNMSTPPVREIASSTSVVITERNG